MSHSLQVEVIPRPPAGEAPERSEGEGGRSFPHVETGSEDFMRNVFSGVICQIMRFEAISISGISPKTTCPDKFFFEISGEVGMIGVIGKVAPLEALHFLLGILHRRVERPNVSFPASRSYPRRPPAGELPNEVRVKGAVFPACRNWLRRFHA